MTTTPTPADERIELTRYGEPQHEATTTGGELARYGEPQHDTGRFDPQVAERIGYADRDLWDDFDRGSGPGESDHRIDISPSRSVGSVGQRSGLA